MVLETIFQVAKINVYRLIRDLEIGCIVQSINNLGLENHFDASYYHLNGFMTD